MLDELVYAPLKAVALSNMSLATSFIDNIKSLGCQKQSRTGFVFICIEPDKRITAAVNCPVTVGTKGIFLVLVFYIWLETQKQTTPLACRIIKDRLWTR